MASVYTFGRSDLPANALGYAKPKQQPEVVDLTCDDEPVVKQEKAHNIAPQREHAETDNDNEYICPISMDLMKDPVMADDGHMYDLTYILGWFGTAHGNTIKSPKTNQMMTKGLVRPWAFHKAYAAWASVHGKPAPVAAGPYGRIEQVRNEHPVNPLVEEVPMGHGYVPPNAATGVELYAPLQLHETTTDTGSSIVSVAFASGWTEREARTVLKANFPRIRFTANTIAKDTLIQLLRVNRAVRPGLPLWTLEGIEAVYTVIGETANYRFNIVISVETAVCMCGPVTTIADTFKRLTLSKIQDIAADYAPQLVPRMTTKAVAVRLISDYVINNLCTPI